MTKTLKQKLDARGHYSLREGELKGSIPILVRTESNPSEEQQKLLDSTGYHYRVVVGDILSGYVETEENLEKLADLPFVCQIEVSAPLYAETT